ncbi:MAG: hypothetical protein M1823_004811 [Watsoniomyces obsoletus]|nr:MAG: hypothetical protein M1823_004811 [Watsoniomyces obsoletus]
MSPGRASDRSTTAGGAGTEQVQPGPSESRSVSFEISGDDQDNHNEPNTTTTTNNAPRKFSKHYHGRDKEKDFPKPRLSDQARRSNHIASEQKRRQAIRDAFDRLTELVPGIQGQGRSEGLVLKKTLETMHEAMGERKKLIAEIEGLGGQVPEDLKLDET